MEALRVGLLLVLCCGTISSSPISNKNAITWPSEYYFKLEILDFTIPMEGAQQIWYSKKLGRSCRDYNVMKLICYRTGKYPIIFQTITSVNLTNQMICLEDNLDQMSPDPKNFLPDPSNFTDSGQSTLLYDKIVDIWTSEYNIFQQLIAKETLYVFKTPSGYHLPLRHVYKTYDLQNGSMKKSKITNYYNFNATVSKDQVTIGDGFNCPTIAEFWYKNTLKHQNLGQKSVTLDLDTDFDRFITNHNKSYHQNLHIDRKKIFENNLRMIMEHNRKDSSYKMALNQFADKTQEELTFLSGTLPSDKELEGAEPFPFSIQEVENMVRSYPANYDLRMVGIISSPKVQGPIGTSWAFATAGAVETAIARKQNGKRLDLSEQAILDCTWGYGSLGVNGGWLNSGLELVKVHGIPKEMDYSFIANDGKCKLKNMTNTYKIRGYGRVPVSVNAMKVALHEFGAVAVGIRFEYKMLFYAKGVYKSEEHFSTCDKAHPNYPALVVGYGTMNGEEYWIIKNSFGAAWGMNGFMLLSADENECFLTLQTAYYPIV